MKYEIVYKVIGIIFNPCAQRAIQMKEFDDDATALEFYRKQQKAQESNIEEVGDEIALILNGLIRIDGDVNGRILVPSSL